MKILVTGTTNQQAGEGTRLGYEPVADLFVKGLRHLGHDVFHGVVPPGDLAGLLAYDAVVVGIVPPLSIAAKYLYPALWAIHAAERARLPIVFFVDDWAFPTLITKLGTCQRNPHHLIKPYFARRPYHHWAVENVGLLSGVIDRLLERRWAPTVIPTFTWGDHDRLGQRLPMAGTPYYVDPSPFVRDYPFTFPAERQRAWVLGTVSDQRAWLDKLSLTWPVRYAGSRSSKAPERLQERDLVQAYADARGVLSPVYPSIAGTGWWRNRFVYAAETRSILLADPREVKALGEAYAQDWDEVEEMTDAELDALADWQQKTLLLHRPTANEAAGQLRRALTAAIERAS